ncbi:hypothetical protein J2W56_001090 [Nocardia kruczakiae]|uniref:Uncharacterized protein n=1 Tax=Nocardia kruczakiae TaxID=261477 RepID=A0ABU1XBG1_9NOCA|nr:hypothetical protein [Nocardia kruczakiae]MDR7167372.1 hypothetical protein [Nocardia kruczakiae]
MITPDVFPIGTAVDDLRDGIDAGGVLGVGVVGGGVVGVPIPGRRAATCKPSTAAKGVRALNVNPGFVLTEHNSLGVEGFGFDPRYACTPQAVAAAIAWLVTSPEADVLQRANIEAQEPVLERGLYPDWRPR